MSLELLKHCRHYFDSRYRLRVDFPQIKGEKEQNMAIHLPQAYDLEKNSIGKQ